MTAYAILHGYVQQEVTGIEIDGKSYHVDDIRRLFASPAVVPVASVKPTGWLLEHPKHDKELSFFPLAEADKKYGYQETPLYALSSIIPATKGGEAPWRDIPVTDDTLDYVSKYGGRCRDCADEFGICPGGLPCKLDERHAAIRHVLRAINYGMSHGFLAALARG